MRPELVRVCGGFALLAAGLVPALPAWADWSLPPELATDYTPHPVATGRHSMAVTANPHATEAALAILREGGSAVDAAIAGPTSVSPLASPAHGH